MEFVESSITAAEDVGSVSATLRRTGASDPVTVTVQFMTLQAFSERNTSAPGSCQLGLPDIGVADLAAVDKAEGETCVCC